MTSVWKRLQRAGKRASKFQFAASFQELTVECTKKWQPDKLRVVWTRRNRRICSKLHGWQPGIKNPYRGTVVWQVPESVDISVTLFKDPNADEFEDKDWTFIIENETKGHRKVLASVDVNMKKYASATPAQFDLTLTLKPLSVKVLDATLKLTLSCVFLKEGKATDEDMQSLASLMSLKQSDIGNLDDFNDSDEEEDKRLSAAVKMATAVIAPLPPARRIHDKAWRPAVDTGPSDTAHSEPEQMSCSFITPNVPLQYRPLSYTALDPSAPPLSTSYIQPSRTASSVPQTRPSPYAFTVPAFARAHPPALPKIFQPPTGSVAVSVTQRPSGGLARAELLESSRSAEGSAVPPQRPFSFLPGISTPFSSSSAQSSLSPQQAPLPDTTQKAAHSATRSKTWRPHSFPSSHSSPSDFDPSSFEFGFSPQGSMTAPRPSKMYRASLAEPGSALTKPTSMPSATETASWQKEWRSPKLHPTLCPAPLTSPEHINQQRHPASITSSPPAQTPPQMYVPLPAMSSSHVLPQPMSSSTITPNPVVTSPSVAPFYGKPSDATVSTSCSQTPSAAVLSPAPTSLVSPSIAPAASFSSPSTFYPCVSTLLSSPPLVVSDAPLSSTPDVGPVVTASVVAESEPLPEVQTSEWRHQVVPTVVRPNVRRPVAPLPVNAPTSPLSSSPFTLPSPSSTHIYAQTSTVAPVIAPVSVPSTDSLTEKHRQLSVLAEEECPNTLSSADEDADVHQNHEPHPRRAGVINIANQKPNSSMDKQRPVFGLEVVRPAKGPESMTSLLPTDQKSPSVTDVTYFELPKSDLSDTDRVPTHASPKTAAEPAATPTFAAPLTEVQINQSENLQSSAELAILHSAAHEQTEDETIPHKDKTEPFQSSVQQAEIQAQEASPESVPQMLSNTEMSQSDHINEGCQNISTQIPSYEPYRDNSLIENEEVDQSVLWASQDRPKQFAGGFKKEEETTEDPNSLVPLTEDRPVGLQQECFPNMVDLLPSCPLFSRVFGCPSTALSSICKTDVIIWPTNLSIIWNEPRESSKNILLMPNLEKSPYATNMVSLTCTCPNESRIPGFPSAKRPREAPCMSFPETSIVVDTSSQTPVPEEKHHEEWLSMETSLLEERPKPKPILHIESPAEYSETLVMIEATVSSSKLIPDFTSAPKSEEILQSCEVLSLQESIIAESELKDDSKPANEIFTFVSENAAQMPDSIPETQVEYSETPVMMEATVPSSKLIPDFTSAPKSEEILKSYEELSLQESTIAESELKDDSKPANEIFTFVSENAAQMPDSIPETQVERSVTPVMMEATVPSSKLIPDFASTPKSEEILKSYEELSLQESTIAESELKDDSKPANEIFTFVSENAAQMPDSIPETPVEYSETPVMMEATVLSSKLIPDFASALKSEEIFIESCEELSLQESTIAVSELRDVANPPNEILTFVSANALQMPDSVPETPFEYSETPVTMEATVSSLKLIPDFTSAKSEELLQSCEVLSLHKSTIVESELREDSKTANEILTFVSENTAQMPDFIPETQEEPNMLELLPSCPVLSRIPGCPSLRVFEGMECISDQTVIYCNLFKGRQTSIFDPIKDEIDSKIIALVPTCPKASCIPGFPSRPYRKSQIEPNMQNICPSCPKISRIAGCPSIQTPTMSNWPLSTVILWSNPLKKPLVVLDTDKICKENTHRMIALAPTCPSVVCVPGFPVVPEPTMLRMLPTCPEKSNVIGFSSKRDHLDWCVDKKTLRNVSLEKQPVVLVDREDWLSELFKIMFALAPTCPSEARIPGFPYAPKCKATLPPSIVAFHQCVPKMSRIMGFSSSEGINAGTWFADETSLLERPLRTPSELLLQFNFTTPYEEIDKNILQRMFALAPTCPREARIPGFPSLPQVKVDGFYLRKEPDVVSLLHSCPMVSFIVGVPTVKSVPIEESQESTKNPIWVKPLKERPVLSLSYAKDTEEYSKAMFLLAPTCPEKARNDGFPCLERLKKEEGIVTTVFSASLEAPISATDEAGVSNLVTEVPCSPAEARLPDFPDVSTYAVSPSSLTQEHTKLEAKFTQYIESERNQMLDTTGPDNPKEIGCFQEMPLAEDSIENREEKCFLEEQHVGEQPDSKTHETTEPGETAIALGWEVLEADDTSTEKRRIFWSC
ncbi:uncharacterized protein ehbp1l1a isoform X14 [Labeo rohita]|uniref:uncharacterized protein ehbp1l1a isoform X14 n=1 Tax=Labeo rohita TaxID=84645 RepID=UPI0021E2532C|nr:uncharacterized protein ehbp1l1a isoform X14 [Labeo rohita]